MKLTISEMARKSGVSVRTLHYYDEIGLLKPAEVADESGYRFYNEESMLRLQQILFYRELDFSLKEIARIMNASDYNVEEALKKQLELLMLKRDRIDRIIGLLAAQTKGDMKMSFKEFDMAEINEAKEKYAKETEDRWGTTDAYKESQKRTARYNKDDWQKITAEYEENLKAFAGMIGGNPESREAQELVAKWQGHISKYYYDCTREILAGLGQMYIADERFSKNMDKYAEGTAEFISKAIAAYCK